MRKIIIHIACLTIISFTILASPLPDSISKGSLDLTWSNSERLIPELPDTVDLEYTELIETRRNDNLKTI